MLEETPLPEKLDGVLKAALECGDGDDLGDSLLAESEMGVSF